MKPLRLWRAKHVIGSITFDNVVIGIDVFDNNVVFDIAFGIVVDNAVGNVVVARDVFVAEVKF